MSCSCNDNTCQSLTEAGVPGPQGQAGTNGTNGTDGLDAYTTTTANFTQPAVNASVTVSVLDSRWMGVGQNVFVASGGYYEVESALTQTTCSLKNLGTTGNVAVGSTVTSSKKVSPAGYNMPEAAMVANSLKSNPTNASASPTDLPIANNQLAARNSTGNLSAHTITDLALTLIATTTAALFRAAISAAYNLITITGAESITGGGDLTANRTVSLVNDSTTPGNSLYYGTDTTGVKGFFDYSKLGIPGNKTRRFMQFYYPITPSGEYFPPSNDSPHTYYFPPYIAQFAGTVKNLRIYFTVNGDDENYFFYTTKNGVDQAVAAIHNAGAGGAMEHTDLVNSFTVVAGDRIGFRVANNGRYVNIVVDLELLET